MIDKSPLKRLPAAGAGRCMRRAIVARSRPCSGGPMSKLSMFLCTTAVLAVSACISRSAATTPSPATLALYDVNAYQPAAAPAPVATRSAGGHSSGVTTIGDFVRSRNPQLQFCYEETRASNPTLAGSTTIGVLLGPDGTVTRADRLRR